MISESEFNREMVAAFNRQTRAYDIVREIWPWLDDEETKAIARILVEAFNKR